ncbi:MAG: DUF1566 domain-containing protein [Muribaculum sp.]|nr:DUF1566 domain-containing protein [Muribaculum sp.]
MKAIRLFLCLVILIYSWQSVIAQDFTVQGVEETRDLSVSIKPRLDQNGLKCALVKVQCPLEDVVFEGNVIGESEFKAGEYWVYLSPGSKMLRIKHSKKTPIFVNFVDYGITNLGSNVTYNIIINVVNDIESEEIIPFNDPNVELGHKWIDLGLSVKWAQCNIGAKIPTETGQYFAWGELASKDSYVQYNSQTANVKLSDISGDNQRDVALHKWKGNWRMPTYSEFQELKSKCQWRWKLRDGVSGFEIIGPNGNSIFLPCAGAMVGSELNDLNESGDYWTSTPQPNRNAYSYIFDFNKDEKSFIPVERHLGATIRPVINK